MTSPFYNTALQNQQNRYRSEKTQDLDELIRVPNHNSKFRKKETEIRIQSLARISLEKLRVDFKRQI